MKNLILISILIFTPFVSATEIGDSYININEVNCTGDEGSIQMNLVTQTLQGDFQSNGRSLELSFALMQQQGPDFKVELIRDFLESGYDLLGSPVVSKDQTSFGTYAVVLDKKLETPNSQQMFVVYVEAMTGWQTNMKMNCSFK